LIAFGKRIVVAKLRATILALNLSEKIMTKLTIFLVPLILLTACAEVKIRPLKPGERFDQSKADQQLPQDEKYYKTQGVRFFRPHPYLWITASDKGACQMDIVYLPKMDEEYVVTASTGIGSVTMNPTLTNGWSLTALNAAADSKANEMVTAIGNLTGNVAKAAGGGQGLLSTGTEFGPGLYRMIFKEGFVDDLRLVFLQGQDKDNPAKCKELKPPPKS